ncbi:unnamed protein product, partial [Medioppia subpectinata]
MRIQRLNCPNITRDSPTDPSNCHNMIVAIKRPNSTIGIPNSTIEPMFYTADEFKPTTREKATSLTLDPKTYPNSQSNTPNGSPRTSPRTSIILNGNILSSLSPIPPIRPPAPFSSKTHIYDNHLS